ncbi:ATP-dependent helicase HrpB [Breoghania sp.]|uniref:ATP-dependent helicase HrpB n=1 Tax=Breoghania sp. TaxID=2065378 RepID=UPI0029C8F674|nr:ATP-dependent helicase HrpB [Breoghania sp.]
MQTRKRTSPAERLPIHEILGDLKKTLENAACTVLVAPPGAGKTTVVPLALLEESWLAGRRILLLAPRRLAARAAARYMAAILGQKVGQTVGYRVRMESRIGPQTRVEVVTEGVLTRMLQRDPALTDVGLVIFDEFHERSLDADLGLALCRDVQGVLNEDLRLLVMSATLDPAPVADLLGNAPVIRCDGRMFPVETRYIVRPAARSPEQAMAGVIRQSVHAGEGNILAFLPGAAEIRRTVRLLKAADLPGDWTIAPLYGTLPRDRQDAAIMPPPEGRHKIVLATSIAETSLTIEGIRVVVDGGQQRTPRFDPGSGMTRLVTLPVSRASADQRRGRAGRLGPGICYRLWREADTPALAAHNRPEILDADLTALALELAVWGVDDSAVLNWLAPPPSIAFAHARQLLADLEALDADGKITAHGRRMAALPLHPRLAHMVLSAMDARMGQTACDIAAILSERDPIHFTGRWRDADLKLRLEALGAFREKKQFRVHDGNVDPAAVRRILKVSAVLQHRLGVKDRSEERIESGRLLAWAYPDRIARQRPGSPGRFLLTSGRGAFLDPSEPLSASVFLVAPQLDGNRQEARIFLAAAAEKEDLLDQFAHRVRWRETVSWDSRRQAVSAVREQVLGAVAVATEILQDPPACEVMNTMLAGIRSAGIDCLPWTRRLRTWQARVTMLARIDAPDGPWPDVGAIALTENLEVWLAPFLTDMRRLSDLSPKTLSDALLSHLDWKRQRRLEELAPTHMTVPSGSRRPIDYGGQEPILAVRVQEMFGLETTPAIAGGRVPLTLHLLSPANRPVQVTRDLAGFWQNGYPEVKKELKGRYPKHPWPDDPMTASPTSRVKPRRQN